MRRTTLLSVVAVVTVSAGLTMCHALKRPDQITFSHKLHVHGEDMACSSCHTDVAEATTMVASLRPGHAECFECHEDEFETCTMCHSNPDQARKRAAEARRFQPSTVVFNHAAHLGREGMDCASCHAKTAEATRADPANRVRMFDDCMSCHRQDFRNIDCLKCHTDFREVKEKPFSVYNHTADFLKTHGALARTDEMVCAHCHTQSSCAECHSTLTPGRLSLLRSDEPDRQLVHPAGFLARHGIEARYDANSCSKCHQPQRDCSDCHARNGVSAIGGPGLGPHPPGWMRQGSAEFHGPAARRDVANCSTCHDRGPDTNCIACHKVGGSGGNPHPAGWTTRTDPTSGQACIWCHQ